MDEATFNALEKTIGQPLIKGRPTMYGWLLQKLIGKRPVVMNVQISRQGIKIPANRPTAIISGNVIVLETYEWSGQWSEPNDWPRL